MRRTAWMLVALAWLATASAAAATPTSRNLGSKHGLVYRVATDVVGTLPDNYAFFSQDCKGDEAPIGGGALLSGTPDTGRLAVINFAPSDGPPEYVLGEAARTTGTGTMKVYAICRQAGRAGLKFEQVVTDFIAPGDAGSAAAVCPPGTQVVGGGASAGTSYSWLNSSTPFGSNAWQMYGYNGYSGPLVMTVQAMCAKPSVGDVHFRKRTATGVGAGASASLVVECPAASVATGGGAFITGPSDEAWIQTSAPANIGKGRTPADGWRVRVYNASGAPKDVTARAICLS